MDFIVSTFPVAPAHGHVLSPSKLIAVQAVAGIIDFKPGINYTNFHLSRKKDIYIYFTS
jgi:hypothetical protein